MFVVVVVVAVVSIAVVVIYHYYFVWVVPPAFLCSRVRPVLLKAEQWHFFRSRLRRYLLSGLSPAAELFFSSLLNKA